MSVERRDYNRRWNIAGVNTDWIRAARDVARRLGLCGICRARHASDGLKCCDACLAARRERHQRQVQP